MAAATIRPNQRGHILDVTLRIMSDQGAAKTSMRQLARECGINVATLYHYFESKDALLTAVVEERRYGARLAEPPEIDPSWPVEQRVRALFGEMWLGALAEEAIWRLLLGEGLRGEPAVLPVGQALLATVETGLSAWIGAVVPEPGDPAVAADPVIGQPFAGFVRHIFAPGDGAAAIHRPAADALVAALAGPLR